MERRKWICSRKSPMKRQVPGEDTYGVVYKDIDDTKEGMKTTAFWDWFLIVIGFVFFLGFLFTAVISKLLPVSDNLILSAIQNDRYYCFLVPLTLPIALVSVYFHWLSMKLFKHA